MDPFERPLHLHARRLAVATLGERQVERRRRRPGVELPLHVFGLPEDQALSRAKQIERHAERHRPEPRIKADPRPGEAIDPLDHLRVRLPEGVLCGRLGAETREEDAPVEGRAVAVEELSDSRAVPALRPRDQRSLPIEGRGVVPQAVLPLGHPRQTNGGGERLRERRERHDARRENARPARLPYSGVSTRDARAFGRDARVRTQYACVFGRDARVSTRDARAFGRDARVRTQCAFGRDARVLLESASVLPRSRLQLRRTRPRADDVVPCAAMRLRTLAFAAVLACGALSAVPRPARAADAIAIPFTKTTLPNGMTVILSEDHTLPTVVVTIAYWVGSRFEQPPTAPASRTCSST